MPSNAELKSGIDALAVELAVQASTDGLNNAQLADLLSDLRDEKAKRSETPPPAAQAQAEADAAAQVLSAIMTPVASAKPPYYVAPGKAITTKVGIKSGDEDDNEVKAEHFEGGDETLQRLVESGYVLES
jgi:hypothetical protein